MNLDQLIHSLDVQEVSHFRKFGFEYRKDKEQRKALKLFNLILKKPGLGDEKIAGLIIPNEPSSKMRFIKFALKERLLNAMVNYQKKNDQSAIIFDWIQKAELLKERTDLDEALKFAEKALKKALLVEKTELAILAAKTKKRIVHLQLMWKENAQHEIEKLDVEIIKLLDRTKETELFLSADQLLVSLKNIHGWELRSEKVFQDLDKIIGMKIFEKEPQQESFEAFCLFHLCHSRFYGAKGAYEKKLLHEKILVEFMQKDKEKLSFFLNTFRTALNNYLNTCVEIKNFNDFDSYIKQLEETAGDLNIRNKARLFLIVSNLRFNRVLEEQNFEKGYQLVKNYIKLAPLHYPNLAPQFFHPFHANGAIISFLNNDFKFCVKILSHVFSKESKLPGKDLVRICQLLNLLSHFILENFSIVDSINRNMERGETEQQLLSTERSILEFTQKNKRKTISVAHWKQLHKQVITDGSNPEDAKLQALFHLEYWLILRINQAEIQNN